MKAQQTMIHLPHADFLSEREFATLIGKSLRTVRRWHVERRGPTRTRLGRSVFYSRKAIENFLRRLEERGEQS